MSTPVIRVNGLSKRYHIGVRHRQETLYDRIASLITAPVSRLRSFGRSSHKEEDSIWALNDVSFEVAPGEIVGIIGRNGAGKSTLLKILTRITEPTRGRAEIRGRVGSLLEVGTGFHPELTGRENIYLSGAILGMTSKGITRQLDEIIAFAGIETFIDTPVKRYSSGMYVRLGFAIAAYLQPEVLLIDEVLAVGDVEFQRKCLGKMNDVAKSGRTILLVSHNMSAVQRLCHRAIYLVGGEVAKDGPADEVVSQYVYADMETDANESGIWEYASLTRPGGKSVRINQIRLLSEKGVSQATFRIDESIAIKIVYELVESVSNFHFYARIYRQDGTLAFCTADWDGGEVESNQRTPGVYAIRFTIPAHLLNTGSYSLELLGIIPSVDTFFECSNIIHWSIDPHGGAGGIESVNRPGICRPLLGWSETPPAES